METSKTILPLTYLGSTGYYARLIGGGCVVDTGENWVKQTARNRCEILTAGGVAVLTIPVHGYGAKIAVKDIRIDNTKRWQHQHWVSIVSSYRNSPFFDHYEECFAPFYQRRFDFLLDFNIGLMETVLGILRTDVAPDISEQYVIALPGDLDLRGKKALRRGNDAMAYTEEYTQVFYDRTEFTPGLSVIDLLFCESGKIARQMLLRSYPR